jgi:hypothetical protein
MRVSTGKQFRRGVALVAIAAALLVVVAGPAHAGPRVTCEASGNVDVSEAVAGWAWRVSGVGLCVDTLQGPFQVGFTGAGTSDTLGLCDGLLVTDLNLRVTLRLLNLRTGVLRTIKERWTAPLTLYPLATPFLVAGSQSGIGAMFTRILLSCPPGGNSSATFTWNQTT